MPINNILYNLFSPVLDRFVSFQSAALKIWTSAAMAAESRKRKHYDEPQKSVDKNLDTQSKRASWAIQPLHENGSGYSIEEEEEDMNDHNGAHYSMETVAVDTEVAATNEPRRPTSFASTQPVTIVMALSTKEGWEALPRRQRRERSTLAADVEMATETT